MNQQEPQQLFDTSEPDGVFEVIATKPNGVDLVCTEDAVPWSGTWGEAFDRAELMRVLAAERRTGAGYRISEVSQ